MTVCPLFLCSYQFTVQSFAKASNPAKSSFVTCVALYYNTSIAVSYTHLDVYKRQVNVSAQPLGLVLFGPLADVLPVQTVFAMNGALLAVWALAFWRLRLLERA